MKTAKEALATHLNWDISELSEYNYQYGRFTKSVYNINDGIYVAVRSDKYLPKHKRTNNNVIQWNEVKDNFINQYGWLIFKATEY